MAQPTIQIDCLIFGGGVAGLFTLNKCTELGYQALLLESNALGHGQTIDSQGIIHGGLKYEITHGGHNSAVAIREMPTLWRRALAGESTPNLSDVQLRADNCYVWKTRSLTSRLGFLGAKMALRVKPEVLEKEERPEWLCSDGITVARLAEQVIEPRSLLEVLSKKLEDKLLLTAPGGVEVSKDDGCWKVSLLNPQTGEPLNILTKDIVLTAGSGNESLRAQFGLAAEATQTRPLHMVLVRGDLPTINGHCIDGAKTRVTITTTTDYAGRKVWQVGGQLAEDGVNMEPDQLVCHASKELHATLPNLDLSQAEFLTYRSTRAEQFSKGKRPQDVSIETEGHVHTCFPTKLAFAPRLAEAIIPKLQPKTDSINTDFTNLMWPKPMVALPVWESDAIWNRPEVLCT